MAGGGRDGAGDLEVALAYGGHKRISRGDIGTIDSRTHLNCGGKVT